MINTGFLNLNKAKGYTSHDCVAKVRRILKTKKVGHGGTLDPLATGVLPIAVGKATRLLQFLPTRKVYQAKIRFGITTNTDDLEGEVINTQSASHLTLAGIEGYLSHFRGKIAQIPPAFSAIKKNGQKLYELARKGEIVEVPTRQVEIYNINVINWYAEDFPELELEITCGSGTYIRAIARDLGTMVKVGGTLASLKRTLSCGMELKDSLTLEEIEKAKENDNFTLISPDILLQHFPKIYFEEEEARRWCQGQKIIYQEKLVGENCLIYNQNNVFLGIAKLDLMLDDTLIIPKVVFNE